MTLDARFYFANLGADVARCISAARADDDVRYQRSSARARATIGHLRNAHRPGAYEEALLLMRGLVYARESGNLETFESQLNKIIGAFAPV
ncbi:MAG TPA: hypothetical protein VI483_02770 [Candidatus Paceibacterota bacterium]